MKRRRRPAKAIGAVPHPSSWTWHAIYNPKLKAGWRECVTWILWRESTGQFVGTRALSDGVGIHVQKAAEVIRIWHPWVRRVLGTAAPAAASSEDTGRNRREGVNPIIAQELAAMHEHRGETVKKRPAATPPATRKAR